VQQTGNKDQLSTRPSIPSG